MKEGGKMGTSWWKKLLSIHKGVGLGMDIWSDENLVWVRDINLN